MLDKKDTNTTDEELYSIIEELTNCYFNTFTNKVLLNRLSCENQAVFKNRLHIKLVETTRLTDPDKTLPPTLFWKE